MSKSNYKVICFILAVFLLLIGAPFFAAQAKIMDHEISDVLHNKNVVTDSTAFEWDIVVDKEKADVNGLVPPMTVSCHVKSQSSQRLFSAYFMAFYSVGAVFARMNKSFFPMGRYISYNYIGYFLVALRIIHRSDGKCRCRRLCV